MGADFWIGNTKTIESGKSEKKAHIPRSRKKAAAGDFLCPERILKSFPRLKHYKTVKIYRKSIKMYCISLRYMIFFFQITKKRKGAWNMKQAEIAGWLKGITYTIGMMGAVVFFVLAPMLAGKMKTDHPDAAFLYWPVLVYNFVIAVCCYAILFQFWKVCHQIGRDNSFSMENAVAFKQICRLAVLLAAIWFVGFAAISVLHSMQPVILLFLIFAILISFAVAICAAALSHLVFKAYEMRRENELTI